MWTKHVINVFNSTTIKQFELAVVLHILSRGRKIGTFSSVLLLHNNHTVPPSFYCLFRECQPAPPFIVRAANICILQIRKILRNTQGDTWNYFNLIGEKFPKIGRFSSSLITTWKDCFIFRELPVMPVVALGRVGSFELYVYCCCCLFFLGGGTYLFHLKLMFLHYNLPLQGKVHVR